MTFDTVSFVGQTAAVSAAISPIGSHVLVARGKLQKLIITIAGSTSTNSIVITDDSGTVISSNAAITNATYTTWFTNNPISFVGFNITQFSCGPTNTASLPTNTVSALFLK
jgi:hypothetical protein